MTKGIGKSFMLAVLALPLFVGTAFATAGADSAYLGKCDLLKEKLPNLRIDRVLKAPLPGLCEIWTGPNVLYYHPDKDLLVFGEIWDTKGHSLTQDSRNKIIESKIASLPLDAAVKWGDGPVEVIFFTDPDCPFCRKTEKFLFSPLFKKKITAHIFLAPLPSHPNAEDHSLKVLCADDPVGQLLAFADENETAVSISTQCRSKAEPRLKSMRDTVSSLGLNGVPMTIVGKKIVRGANLEEITRLISERLNQKSRR